MEYDFKYFLLRQTQQKDNFLYIIDRNLLQRYQKWRIAEVTKYLKMQGKEDSSRSTHGKRKANQSSNPETASRRLKNTEAVRRFRERKTEEDKEKREQFETNERRISVLERTVEAISAELRGKSPRMPSRSQKKQTGISSISPRPKEKFSGQAQEESEHPHWFGDAF